MTHVTCRLTAKNRDQLRNPTLGNRLWATFTFTHTLRSILLSCSVRPIPLLPPKKSGGALYCFCRRALTALVTPLQQAAWHHAVVCRSVRAHGVLYLNWASRNTALTYTQGEMTSQSLWPRCDRHFVGIIRHNALS